MNRSLLCTLAVALICLVAAPSATGADRAPTAQAAAKCGNVRTVNGGLAKFVFGNKVACITARRVARRARGKTYKFIGFTCKVDARFYQCFKPGTSKGIGFSYQRP